MKTISGIRCDRCKKEVSHVFSFDSKIEASIVREETRLASAHMRECKGKVTRFTRSELERDEKIKPPHERYAKKDKTPRIV